MTFYFYDLETSGVSPKYSRIMQFAGRRVDEDLNPVGEPDDIYIKFPKDILPEPDAVLLTGITPQKTLLDGITEAEFVKYFDENINQPDTVFVGFNNIRFDDEFMRYLFYRNYYDPYEWTWKDNRSRWDILDVVRTTRALRPEGINWPVDSEGRPSNRLESLTKVNGIDHMDAHTALADVEATLALARLVKTTQPNLFDYTLKMRDKKKVRELVNSGQPFAYVSGRYESRYDKLTIAVKAQELADGTGSLVYDLRYDPAPWSGKTDDELREAFFGRSETPEERLPFKVLQYNRCPSVAPYGVVDDESKKRLGIDERSILLHKSRLAKESKLVARVLKLLDERKASFQTALLPDDSEPDNRLYDGFIPDADKTISSKVRSLNSAEIKDFTPEFEDARYVALYPLYKARNHPKALNESERSAWETHVLSSLFGGATTQMDRFLKRLSGLATRSSLTANQKYLLEELKLYAESVTPAE